MLVSSPAFADEGLGLILAIHEADNLDSHGRRVWWRRPVPVSDQHELSFGHFYVSLNPGETRTKPPEGPGDVIREAPLLDSPRTYSAVLRQAIERFNASATPSGSKLDSLVVAARRVLEEAQGKSDAAILEAFRQVSCDGIGAANESCALKTALYCDSSDPRGKVENS